MYFVIKIKGSAYPDDSSAALINNNDLIALK